MNIYLKIQQNDQNFLKMLIYQQKLMLSQLLDHNFKPTTTIFLYKIDNFPKIAVFGIFN